MSRIKVTSTIVVDRPLKPEQGETAAAGFVSGRANVIKDETIESRAHRSQFGRGDGDVSIIVTAGDTIGDLTISVQYEGEVEQYDACLRQQDALIQQTAGWLREILGEFATDWNVEMTSVPCPQGDTRLLHLTEAANQLTGTQTVSHDVGVLGGVTHQQRNEW